VVCDATQLHVTIADGRVVSVPLDWFDWLAAAKPEQRANVEIIEGGAGIWWEQLDDGVSVPGLLGLPEYP
jgi:hypothetical protein